MPSLLLYSSRASSFRCTRTTWTHIHSTHGHTCCPRPSTQPHTTHTHLHLQPCSHFRTRVPRPISPCTRGDSVCDWGPRPESHTFGCASSHDILCCYYPLQGIGLTRRWSLIKGTLFSHCSCQGHTPVSLPASPTCYLAPHPAPARPVYTRSLLAYFSRSISSGPSRP